MMNTVSNRWQDNASNVKYQLSEQEALNLYYSEPRLAMLIDLNVIRLIDNCLVVNLSDFITPKTNHLTATAKRDMASCCVGIKYLPDNRSSIQSTLDLLIQSSAFLEAGKASDGKQSPTDQAYEAGLINNEITRINKILNKLPGAFSESLKSHMEMKGYTEELLSSESWVSLSTIKQYRQNEDKKKTLKTVTQLCIGMHLHPWITEDLISKSGIIITHTKLDSAYRYLYTYLYKDSIQDCNTYLRSCRLPEFTLREKSA